MERHDVIDAWLAARQNGDLDRLASLTAPNAIWHSPVEGTQIGRDAVTEEVRRGFANTDSFESRLIDVHRDSNTSVRARIRNVARRQGKHLDSVQTLHLQVEDEAVSAIRIEVNDPDAVKAFWS